MYFSGERVSPGVRRLLLTMLVVAFLGNGPVPRLISEETTEPAASQTKSKDRSARKADKIARKEREREKKTETEEVVDSKEESPTPGLIVNGKKPDSTQVAIKTNDDLLKPRSMSAEELKHPLAPVIKIIGESQGKTVTVKDYSATFLKKEEIKGKIVDQSMDIKVRESPFSVILKFNNPYRGRQVIYVEGQNNGKMLVKPEGFKSLIGTLSIDPNGEQALAENRYPITQVGISSMLRLVMAQMKSELKYPDIHKVEMTEAKVNGQSCRKIEVTRLKKVPGTPFQVSTLYLSAETLLPVKIENYDWSAGVGSAPKLVEEYTYLNLKINVGLRDQDFR